jgi:hypothetical protein
MTTSVEDFTKLSSNNRDAIKDDTDCGCYFCISTFKGSEIEEWIDSNSTALCPHCGIDSVLPMHLVNLPLDTDKEVLSRGLEHWFTGKANEELPYAEDVHPEIKHAFDKSFARGYIESIAKNDPAMPEILWLGFATGYAAALEKKNDS